MHGLRELKATFCSIMHIDYTIISHVNQSVAATLEHEAMQILFSSPSDSIYSSLDPSSPRPAQQIIARARLLWYFNMHPLGQRPTSTHQVCSACPLGQSMRHVWVTVPLALGKDLSRLNTGYGTMRSSDTSQVAAMTR